MSDIRKSKKTVLSGIQANGTLHIGNYVGSLSVWVANQEHFNNLFCILVLFEVLSDEPRTTIEERFINMGYGNLKKELVELVIQTLHPIQSRYQEIMANPMALERILSDGAERASAIAEGTLLEVKRLVGLAEHHIQNLN